MIATAALFVQQMLIALRMTGTLAAAWLGGSIAAGLTVALTSGGFAACRPIPHIGEAVALGLIVITCPAAAMLRR